MEAIHEIHVERLPERVASLPGLDRLREAAGHHSIYLVGGAVRDFLLGRDRADIDVAVEGDAAEVARSLGGEVREHQRFQTATVMFDGLEVDLASARRETYARPGALPDVIPAGISEDLSRRDFTINAMAVPLDRDPVLLDPHGGAADLRGGLLRILHGRSFLDDPTRAIRAARYASRFDLSLEKRTEAELIAADLDAVSADRVTSELRKLAGEDDPAAAFGLLDRWGVLELPEGASETISRAAGLLGDPRWDGLADRRDAIVAAARPASPEVRALCASKPSRPSEVARLAIGRPGLDLLVARARGAEWLDEWVGGLSDVRLEIDGRDLMAAGVPKGPAVGLGLEAALGAKLDGAAQGRDEELAVALAAVR